MVWKSRHLKLILQPFFGVLQLYLYFLLNNYPIYCNNTPSMALCKGRKGRKCRIRFRRNNLYITIFFACDTWTSHVKELSMWMPSNLVLLICSIGVLSISNLMYFSDSLIRLNFCLDPISIIFVFSMLIFIVLISHHWLTEVAFICNLEGIFWIFLLVWWSVASSANRDMFFNDRYKNISFINKMKNKGPMTEPY